MLQQNKKKNEKFERKRLNFNENIKTSKFNTMEKKSSGPAEPRKNTKLSRVRKTNQQKK